MVVKREPKLGSVDVQDYDDLDEDDYKEDVHLLDKEFLLWRKERKIV